MNQPVDNANSASLFAVLGGSFDPVHEGHLRNAEALRQRLGCEQLVLMPAARSPLKTGSTADAHRLAMLRLAVQDYPGLRVDERELRRPPPSYTIDTLRELRRELGDDTPLVWIIGADALATLPSWKDWQALTDVAHLLVINRPGQPMPQADGADTAPSLSPWLARFSPPAQVDALHCAPSGAFCVVTLPPQPYSSTGIRAALQRGEHPAGLPEPVWQYIRQHGLYQATATPEPV